MHGLTATAYWSSGDCCAAELAASYNDAQQKSRNARTRFQIALGLAVDEIQCKGIQGLPWHITLVTPLPSVMS